MAPLLEQLTHPPGVCPNCWPISWPDSAPRSVGQSRQRRPKAGELRFRAPRQLIVRVRLHQAAEKSSGFQCGGRACTRSSARRRNRGSRDRKPSRKPEPRFTGKRDLDQRQAHSVAHRYDHVRGPGDPRPRLSRARLPARSPDRADWRSMLHPLIGRSRHY